MDVIYEIGLYHKGKPIYLLYNQPTKYNPFLDSFCDWLVGEMEKQIIDELPKDIYLAWDVRKRKVNYP